MPKMKPLKIEAHHEEEWDIAFREEYPLVVDADGVFHADIPREQASVFSGICADQPKGQNVDCHLKDFGLRLQRFCHTPWPRDRDGKESDMSSVPYTEDNAKFFYDTMMAVCTLSDRFEQFFGAGDVAALIQQATNPMLPAPQSVPNSVETSYVDPDDDL